MKQILLGCMAFGFLSGCVSASKDIYYRSRLPTQEIPLLGPDEGGGFGMDVDLEDDRFNFKPTNNLVSNYSLDMNNVSYASRPNAGLAGADLSATYRRGTPQAIFKGAVSFDFAELQANPSRAVGLPEEYFVNLNVGYYKTASGTLNGSGCAFLCFSSNDDRAKAQLTENQVATNTSGREEKFGLQLGHVWNRKHVLSLSYQYMDLLYTGQISKDGSPDLNIREAFYASGLGLGLFERLSEKNTLGITFDQVDLAWRDKPMRTVVAGLRWSLGFY